MFESFLDWLWFALAVAVGTAFARYVPKALTVVAGWAAKVGNDE